MYDVYVYTKMDNIISYIGIIFFRPKIESENIN